MGVLSTKNHTTYLAKSHSSFQIGTLISRVNPKPQTPHITQETKIVVCSDKISPLFSFAFTVNEFIFSHEQQMISSTDVYSIAPPSIAPSLSPPMPCRTILEAIFKASLHHSHFITYIIYFVLKGPLCTSNILDHF